VGGGVGGGRVLEWGESRKVLMEQVGSAASRGARQQLTQQALENARPRRHEPIPYEEFPADPDYEVELNREVEEKAPKLFRREERGLNRLLSLSYPWDREPGAGEVRMFHELEGALRRASFRERDKAKVAFDRPPGRMSGRDMVQRRAQIQMGQVPTARPWRRQVYAHTPSPTIHTLIITNAGREMGWVRRPIEGIVWAVARAVGALGGRADALTTGGWALTEAGRIPNLVPHMSTENFSGDLRLALRLGVDHLGLTTAKGVRSVFIITDGWDKYSPYDHSAISRDLRGLLEAGIHITWITFHPQGGQDRQASPPTDLDWLPQGVARMPITGQHLGPLGEATAGGMAPRIYERALGRRMHFPNYQRQRRECDCYLGADIGAYDSCPHLCRYCYANTHAARVRKNRCRHDPQSPFLIGYAEAGDRIHTARQESWLEAQENLF